MDHRQPEEPLDLGDGVRVRTAPLAHPNGATGYRVESDGVEVEVAAARAHQAHEAGRCHGGDAQAAPEHRGEVQPAQHHLAAARRGLLRVRERALADLNAQEGRTILRYAKALGLNSVDVQTITPQLDAWLDELT